MTYEYINDKGRIIEREFSMCGEIPRSVEKGGVIYRRKYSSFQISIPIKASNAHGKDMDDFSRCKISTGNIKVKSKSGRSYVPAQLRVDGDGAERLVYKSNPCQDTGIKPTQEVLDGLGGSMEKFI